MDRNEAVLRELNLYPQWVRRGKPAPAGTAVETRHPVSPAPSGKSSSPLAGSLKAGVPAAGDSVIGERCAAADVVPVGKADNSRAQRIGELDWPQLKAMVRDCTACRLRAGCTQTVFGNGDERADWLFVGEGPGEEEDARGEPFVGQAGKLLDNMLMAVRLRRGENVYIANVVKCRPPGNRNPDADEIATCLPYLQRQIGLIQPRLIVALGKTASTALLGTDAPLGTLRGRLHDFNVATATSSNEGEQAEENSCQTPLPHPSAPPHRVGASIPLIVTYHPAYLLRSPAEKAKAWQDLCFALENMRKLQGHGAP